MQITEPLRSSGEFSFPWTKEKIRRYLATHNRRVAVQGNLPLRLAVWLAVRLARSLSWEGAYRLGGWIGRALYGLKVRRPVAMTNLDIVFGESKTASEKDDIYRRSLLNFGRQAINYLRIPLMDEAFWRDCFKLENEHVLHNAYNQGRGVVFLYMHFGPWELPGGKISFAGYPISVVAKKIKNPVIDKLVVEARDAMGLGTIAHRDSMERIRAGLARGEGVIMVIDQNMKRSQGMFVEWLGRAASTPRSTAWIVRETGAPVISGYAVQSGPRQFKMVLTEEVMWIADEDPQEELRLNTQRYVDDVQRHIYAMPEQWFWLHRRWKIQPEGVENPYRDK
ncbi:MAG TPA: lysophospholipid acyltransferase family protein [bacterium]|nr:lysophospholipid acyltransferase family protein [bacterium]